MQVANRPARTLFVQIFRLGSLGFALFFTLVGVAHSMHWPLMGDAAVIHYGSFLIAQGKILYRDIIEPDLPATYLIQTAVLHIFGHGDLAWRLYDLFLLAALIAAGIVIARPYDWTAGLFAGLAFVLIHLDDGPEDLGQRELLVAVCLVVALAFLLQAGRSRKPWLMLLFGFLIGTGSSVKPPACLLGIMALLMLLVALRRQHVAIGRYVAFALLGFFLAASFTAGFFMRYHDFGDFLRVERLLIPLYEKMGPEPLHALLHWLPMELKLMLPLAVLLAVVLAVAQYKAGWHENWERAVLFVAACCGLFSFLAQHKQFVHHLYTFAAFSLLFFFLEVFKALRSPRVVRFVGAVILLAAVFILRGKAHRLRVIPVTDPMTPAMVADLERLGGASLSNRVQCLDVILACPSSFYRLKLVADPAFPNDFILLGPPGLQPIPEFRRLFWDGLQANPPDIILVTNMWFFGPTSFDKLNQWPQLATYLDSHYSLETTRSFGKDAYRIYRRKNSARIAMSAPEQLSKTAP